MFTLRSVIVAVSLAAIAHSPADAACTKDSDDATLPRHAFIRADSPTGFTVERWHLVGPSGAGDFAGHSNEWAVPDEFGNWSFEAPVECAIAYVDVDYVREAVGGGERYTSVFIFESGTWVVMFPGWERHQAPFNGNLTITASQLETAGPVRLYKNDTTSPTWTLPGGVNEFYGPPQVIVANIASSGSITVQVAGGGTINGAASVTVGPNSVKTFTFVTVCCNPGQWVAQ